MMYQKTLVTCFSRKGFFTPGGANADLMKKGLRHFSMTTFKKKVGANADLMKKGLRLER